MTNATNNTNTSSNTTTGTNNMTYITDTSRFSGTKAINMFTRQLITKNPMDFGTDRESAHPYALLATVVFRVVDSMRNDVAVDATYFDARIKLAISDVAEMNMMYAGEQLGWLMSLTAETVMSVLELLDMVSVVEETGTVALTRTCIEMVIQRKGMKPALTVPGLKPADRIARDLPHLTTSHKKAYCLVKGGLGDMSVTGKAAISVLQGTAFTTNMRVLEAYSRVAEAYAHLEWIKENRYALEGAKELGTSVFYQQYDADKRDRMYAQCHLGPNPMGGDVQQGLCSFADTRVTKQYMDDGKTISPACRAFLDEMADVSGGGKWMKKSVIMSVVANPQQFVLQYALDVEAAKQLTEEEAAKAPKADQPDACLKYLAMAFTYADFVDNGEACIVTPIGLDAKCSGTQIYSILANEPALGDKCGLTLVDRNDAQRKAADPYTAAANHLNKWLADNNYAYMGRNELKTPYMAIQYGGSVKAVISGGTSAKFRAACLARDADPLEVGKEAVKAINKVLGTQVVKMIKSIGYNVWAKCAMEGSDYFNVKMTDGTVIKNPIRNMDEICPAFTIVMQPERFSPETGEVAQDAILLEFGGTESRTEVDENGDPVEMWAAKSSLDKDEFSRTFAVNYIQSLDALLARTVARFMKEAGVTSYVSVHDCFRCHAEDFHLLLSCIRKAYIFLFVEQDQYAALEAQVGKLTGYTDLYEGWVAFERKAGNFVTEELLNDDRSYYFCK